MGLYISRILVTPAPQHGLSYVYTSHLTVPFLKKQSFEPMNVRLKLRNAN